MRKLILHKNLCIKHFDPEKTVGERSVIQEMYLNSTCMRLTIPTGQLW